MSSHPPDVTLAEIRHFLTRLVELSSSGKQAFLDSWRDQEAAQMLLTKLAEAVGRLPQATLASWHEVPWQQIRGMRNRLVHAYHTVDVEVLWETVATDAAELLTVLGRTGSNSA